MRVAIVSTYPPQSCGIGTYTQYLADELVQSGCDVTILTEFGSAPMIGPSLNVRPCFDGEADYVQNLLSAITAAGVQAVHIQHEYGIFGFDQRFLALLDELRGQNIPTIVTLHTVHTALSIDLGCARRTGHHPPEDFDVEAYQKELCARAAMVVVHQDRTTRQILIRQGASPFSVVTIPHGTLIPARHTPTDVRKALGVDEDGALIVALGYFEPAKNILFLLEALAALRRDHPRITVLIGGHIRHDGPETLTYMLACQAYIAAHDLSDILTIIPHELTDFEMTDIFSAADVACFAYDEDTRSASGALHRALGCGSMIVASRIAKFDELSDVADELLVSPRAPEQLVRLLSRLLDDPHFRRNMADRLSILFERTRWPVVAARHLDLYHHLARAPVTRLPYGEHSLSALSA